MQVVHIAFTHLRLTLIYFYLESKILVKIPDSVLEYALALRGKVGDIVRETDLVKMITKQVYIKIKLYHGKLKTKYL